MLDTKQPGVLVVEDDLFFSVRIETTLKKMGYDVEVLTDGERALAFAAERAPALAIVNFGSDRLSPADLVRRIKALPNPPTVLGFVSHTWMPQVRPAAMAAGCDALVANSALVMRLPQLVARLAPLNQAAEPNLAALLHEPGNSDTATDEPDGSRSATVTS